MHMLATLDSVSHYFGLVSFIVGLPTLIATNLKVRQARLEAKEAREGLVISANCLEFVTEDGQFLNVVALETLHSLPKPGDVVLLPGGEIAAAAGHFGYGAYAVTRVEHIYARVEPRVRKEAKARPASRQRPDKLYLPGQARLAKAVAHVQGLSPAEQQEIGPEVEVALEEFL